MTALAWDPAGAQLALATLSNGRHELRAGVPLRGLEIRHESGLESGAGRAQHIRDLAWASGGERIVMLVPAGDPEAPQGLVLETDTWSVVGRLKYGSFRSNSAPTAIAAAARSDLVLAGSTMRQVWFWDARDDTPLQPRGSLNGHVEEIVDDVALSADGSRGASVARGGLLRVWDLEQRRSLASHSIAGTGSTWVGCAIDPDGRRVAAIGAGRLRVWDVGAGAARVLSGHESYVYYVDLSPDGRTILSRGFDSELRLWDSGDGRPLATLRDEDIVGNPVFSHEFAFSSDGTRIVGKLASMEQLGFSIADVAADTRLRSLSPPGAIAHRDEREFRIRTQAEWLELVGRRPSTPHYPVSPDGEVGLDAWTRALTDAEGRVLRELEGSQPEGYSTFCASFSPDGRFVAVANPTAQVYEVATGALVGELDGHPDVYGIAWSPDGRRIATGSNNQTIRIWDAQTLETLLVLREHEGYVHGLAWGPDGTQLVSGSEDGTVRVWDSRPASERAAASVADARLRDEVREGVESRWEELRDFQALADELRADPELDEPARRASLAVVRELVEARRASRYGQLEEALRSGRAPAAHGSSVPGLARRFVARSVRPTTLLPEVGSTPVEHEPDPRAGRVWFGAEDGLTLAVDASSGASLDELGSLASDALDPPLRGAWLAPDERRLAAGGWGTTVWDTRAREVLAHRALGIPTAVAWHPRDESLWFLEAPDSTEYGGHRSRVVRWDGHEFEERLGLAMHWALGLSPDGATLGLVRTPPPPGRGYRALAELVLFDTETLEPRGSASDCTAFDFTPNGDLIVGRTGGWVEILDGETLEGLESVGRVAVMAVLLRSSPDGDWIACAARDDVLWLWDRARGRDPLRFPFERLRWRECNLEFSPDAERLSWRMGDALHVLELDRVHGLRIHARGVSTPELAWIDNDRLALRDAGGPRVWSAVEGRELPDATEAWPNGASPPALTELEDLLEGDLTDMSCLARDPSSGELVGGDDAGRLRFWDGETGELLLERAAHDAPVRAIAVSPTGDWFASADATGEAAIWDARP